MSGEKWCPAGSQDCVKVYEDSFRRRLCSISNAHIESLEVCGNPSAKRAPVKSDAELLREAERFVRWCTGVYVDTGAPLDARTWLHDYRAAHPEGGR
jgi:hypothetical protein